MHGGATLDRRATAGPRSDGLRPASAMLFALVPFGIALVFTLAFGVDVPRLDDWHLIDQVERSYDGSLSFEDLSKLHNEHVAVFPRLVMIALARATGLDYRAQMLASVLFMAATMVMLARALLRIPGLPSWSVPLAAAFVFSLHALDTWLWACQIHVAIAVFGGVSALVLLGAEPLRLRTLFGATFFAFVSSWSFLSGFLVWPAGALVLALRPFENRRARVVAWLVWMAVGAVAVLLPLARYGSSLRYAVPGTPIGLLLEFTARYLGAGLLGEAQSGALSVIGWIALVSMLVGAAFVAWSRRLSPAVLCVVAISLFGFLTGPMIALGRVHLAGLGNASASRYVSFSSLAWVFILLIPALALERPGRVVRFTHAVIAAAAVVTLIVTQIPAIEAGRALARARTEAAAALRTGEGITFEGLEAAGSPVGWLPRLSERLAILRRRKLSFFRNATPEELRPAPFTGELSATITVTPKEGRLSATADVRGGVAGNLAVAVVGRREALSFVGFTALDARGSGLLVCDLGALPGPAPAALFVASLDREGNLIHAAPFPLR